jgi:hypothetical protein
MTLRSVIKTLVVLSLGLPVVHCVLIWVRGMVASMGDQEGASIIGHAGTACLAAWSISLVGLVILLGVAAVVERPADEDADR